MANPEHLAKLKEGVEAWNQWRQENYEIKLKPDLSNIDLKNFQLNNYKLSGSDFSNTNLNGAHFQKAEVMCANFSGANLTNTKLEGCTFYRNNLSYANLSGLNLMNVNLRDVILSNANLSKSILLNVKLYMVDLSNANLTGANLMDANLKYANFTGADLSHANLKNCQALETNFEDATFTGACIEDWHINSRTNLQNVKCDYIYLFALHHADLPLYVYPEMLIDRIPHDPDKIFAPGEFTKRYQKILETVNLYFGEGIDWQGFLNSFQKLQEEERIKIADGEREIPIVQGIENTGDGSFVIKIGVSPDTDKGEIEKSFWQKYQPMLEMKEEQIKFFLEELTIKRQENTKLIRIIETMAEKESSNYEIKGNYYDQKGNVGIGHISGGTISGNAKVAGVINEAATQNLAQAAVEIQQLLDQLSQTYPTKTTSEKMAVGAKLTEEIENNPTRWQKVINVIKAMGIEAVAEAVDNPIFNIAKAGIEAALESES